MKRFPSAYLAVWALAAFHLSVSAAHAGCFGDHINQLGARGGFGAPSATVHESAAVLDAALAGKRRVVVRLQDGSTVAGEVISMGGEDAMIVSGGGGNGHNAMMGRRIKVSQIADGGVSFADARLPNGESVAVGGDQQYVSWATPGNPNRTPGRVTRISVDARGATRVEVEEITAGGMRTPRELTPEELQTSKYSKTSQDQFAARGGARPAPAPVAAAPRPVELNDAVPPSGQRIALQGDESFVSMQNGPQAQRVPGRVRRIWTDPQGRLHVEAEVMHPSTQGFEVRELTEAELANVKPSGTAKSTFASRGAPPAAAPAAPKLAQPGNPGARKAVFGDQKGYSAFEGGRFQGSAPNPRNPSEYLPIHYNTADREFARQAGRLFEDTTPASLPRGRKYNYIVTEDGKMTFGEVTDGLEFGVKHAHLANGRKVLVAGEISIAQDGRYVFNLESGSYSRRIMEKGLATPGQLEARAKSIFEGELGEGQFTQSKITSAGPASPQDLQALCASAIFTRSNPHFCQ